MVVAYVALPAVAPRSEARDQPATGRASARRATAPGTARSRSASASRKARTRSWPPRASATARRRRPPAPATTRRPGDARRRRWRTGATRSGTRGRSTSKAAIPMPTASATPTAAGASSTSAPGRRDVHPARLDHRHEAQRHGEQRPRPHRPREPPRPPDGQADEAGHQQAPGQRRAAEPAGVEVGERGRDRPPADRTGRPRRCRPRRPQRVVPGGGVQQTADQAAHHAGEGQPTRCTVRWPASSEPSTSAAATPATTSRAAG